MLAPALRSFPFSRGIADTIVLATSRIMELEAARGQISRRERSALTEETQPYQDFVDHVLLAMADISYIEAEALQRRLATMW
jgi:hypothetical protein